MGHEDVAMENFVAEGKWPLNKCLGEVASSDLYVGIFAWRYGYIPDGYDKSMTELEYRKAIDTGKNCLVFLLHEDAAWPRKLMDKDEKSVKLEALRQELLKKYQVSFFESAADLASKVGASVHNWENEGITHSAAKKAKSIDKTKLIDVEKYTKTVYDKYRNLDLDTLTPSKKEEYLTIKLSNVFVEQNVRERMPPVELPKEMWKKIQEQWDPEKKHFPEGLNLDEIKTEKESYYSKEPKAVLDVITDDRNKQLVILGDPGSGKSTLTKYLLLSILNINHEDRLSKKFNGYLPLLIELRKFTAIYSKEKCESFLDYFTYLDKKAIFDLPKAEIEKYIEDNGKVLVIFDGLDEVFDPEECETIVHMIAGFKNRYPKIRIIVTSRVVGYKRSILEDAGFTHFTIQEFEETQIKEFLDKWYSIVLDNEEEISEKKARIFRALKESSSIRELAGNPLLLTILAIVGKHQELPRERWKLYDHAAGVLVEHWDVNRHLKNKKVKIDFIGEEDKKELLMRIACRMQSGPKGLAGNFIHKKDLHDEIEKYIKFRYEENPSDAKLIAIHMVNQLRERNFILCLYGADVFGFVHRTFLEYFCAMDIVKRFDNHELNVENLKKDYYENYWDDPIWHEVLRLVCGMKDKFSGDIIECLMQAYDPQYFGNRPPLNISLAIKCLSELRNPNAIEETAKKLLERVLILFKMVRWTQDINQFLAEEVVPAAKLVGDRWPHKDIIIDQFSQSKVYMHYYSFLGSPDLDLNLNNAWAEFINGVDSNSEKLHKEALRIIHKKEYSSLIGVLVLGNYEPKDKVLFYLFLDLSANSRYYFIRQAAIQELARGWHDDPETLKFIKQRATTDEEGSVRRSAVQELARGWHDDPETLNIIKKRATTDEQGSVRMSAVQELARGWHDDPETLNIIKKRATTDEQGSVRRSAVQELARGWHDDPETLNIIKKRATTDEQGSVRMSAVQELARGWHDDPETLKFIKQRATTDEQGSVRRSAVQELARGWHDDPETLKFIKQRDTTDERWDVRMSAVQELARGWHDDPETLKFIKQRATTDEEGSVRRSAVQELKKWWGEEVEENIEENGSSKILKEDFSGVVVYEGIESEYAKTVSQPAYYNENLDISEKVGIPEKTDTGKVDAIVQKENVYEFKVHDDLSNIKTLLVPVSKREKELVRIAAVQLNFKLSDAGFPPSIIDKDRSKAKVLRALEMALNEGADIVCLPELCVCEDWIPEIMGVCQNVAVIAGSYYDSEKHNICKPLLGSGADIPSQIKITPSPFEEAGIINKKMVPGDKLHIYDTRVGKFSVLICRDFINLRHHLRGKTDIIFVPSYNEKIERFHEDANNHITNSPGYIVISNTSLYGGTSVFGIIRKEFNSDLVEAGYKVEGDGIYKLCELRKGEEGLIIADFNLIHKSIQAPAPANPAEEIRPVSHVYKKITEF